MKHKTLQLIVDDLVWFEQQALLGEEIDIEKFNESDAKMKDKVDASIYVEGQLEAREEHLKKIKSQIEAEIKFTKNERIKVRQNIANELSRLNIKSIMTKMHKVTVKLSNWSMNPSFTKKAKTREELLREGIDERCIVEDLSYKVSSSLAKEIMTTTGEIPEGFSPSQKNSITYRKGKINE